MSRLETRIGRTRLKNPLIAASAEQSIEPAGMIAAIRAGAGAVVTKSINESMAARDQLQRAEYAVLDGYWRPLKWGPDVPREAFLATRSGLYPHSYERWLEESVALQKEAKANDCVLVPSVILSGLERTLEMAKEIEASGFEVFELNIGTPYATEASKGAVSTELQIDRITEIVKAVRAVIKIPLWIKVTGQSERVPDLAHAAFAAGADSVVMAGRLLGMIPDLDTQEPYLGTSLGVGGSWNLPLTCHWLALSRARVGKDKPLIGINGAIDGLDVARMMLAGASAVGIASAVMLRGFDIISDGVKQLDDYLAKKNMKATDLIGLAADKRKLFYETPLRTDNWRNYVPDVAKGG
jgi:dihydroorotate dehydrogenase (NAD+) catalytic subunit